MTVNTKNRTFRNGHNSHLNACVGDNSGTDNRNGYTMGFGDAAKVLLSAAVREHYIDPFNGDERGVFMDALIYPICFCARHHIELFLKREIHNVSSIRSKTVPVPIEHDLRNLWNSFIQVCGAADRRILELALPMQELVLDFAAIDPTGQTFRYAHDTSNQEHLLETRVINLEVLSDRFGELSRLIEEFEVTAVEVIREYQHGTFTSKLSRHELFELARQLPPRSQWAGSSDFEAVKIAFREKYRLSSNDFRRAVCLIERHPRLSMIVGQEIPIAELKSTDIEKLRKIYFEDASASTLSPEKWASIAALCEVGRSYIYGESYSAYYNDALQDVRDGRLDCPHILRTATNRNRFFAKGLKEMGQSSLLSQFEISFANLAK